jgi:hypothetical protein
MKFNNIFSKSQISEFNKTVKEWTTRRAYRGDYCYRDLYDQDREDLRHIISLLKKAHYNEASIKIKQLDSVVRDIIPGFVYNKLFLIHNYLP